MLFGLSLLPLSAVFHRFGHVSWVNPLGREARQPLPVLGLSCAGPDDRSRFVTVFAKACAKPRRAAQAYFQGSRS
jgi:hypothetical protein